MRVMPHFLLWCIGVAKAETQTSDAERNCLAHYATGKRRLVEIGVWHGVTTCRLRKAMASDGVLLAVDPYRVGRLGFSAQRVIARREVGKIPNGSVQWVRSTGVQAARDYIVPGDGPVDVVDFVFIDGDHSHDGLRGDWESWSPLVGPGSIIALHDSCSSATRQIDDAGSAVFTSAVILRDPRFELIEVIDTLSVLRRHNSG